MEPELTADRDRPSLGTRPKQEMFRVWNFAIDHLVQEECFAACAEFNSRNQSINELRYY